MICGMRTEPLSVVRMPEHTGQSPVHPAKPKPRYACRHTAVSERLQHPVQPYCVNLRKEGKAMRFIPDIQAYTDESHAADTELLRTETIVENAGDTFVEFHGMITNISDRTVFLERVRLARVQELPALGLGKEPYLIYCSGRHKNDMPGVFETGCADERLADVSAVMKESGEGMADGPDHQTVVSVHLTVIRGKNGLCLAAEFLSGRDQLLQTRILLNEQKHFMGLVPEVIFRIELSPGRCVRTESLRLVLTDRIEDEVERFAARRVAGCRKRNTRHPTVFCTWYYYGLTVTYDDVMRNLNVIQSRRLPYDVFQVDEGWEKTLGEYEPNEKFPVSMKQLAGQIRSAGLVPGLWSSPFVAHETASVWQKHPEWILRDREGNPCLFPMNETVYYVFDITCPETWVYFRELYRSFTEDWGYTYHKLDFTRAAVLYEDAAFTDRSITLAQAYYQAVRAIRDGMGEDAFFLMCGGLYDPIIGLVDAQRTGSDVLSMWSSNVVGGGKTAPYTIRQSMMRYYMNAWWANDPDALMIRRNPDMERGLRLTYGLLSDDEVRTSVINQFAGGGIMCQTEPLDRIGDDRLMEIRHILPVTDTCVRPLNLMSGERFPEAMDVYVKKTGVHCLCMINWSDTAPRSVKVNLKGLVEEENEYVLCDFYTGEYRTAVRSGDTVEFPALRPHAATVIKVEKMADQPIIVASNGHYSMGAECSRLDITGNILRVHRPALFPVRTTYEILLPSGWRSGGKQTVRVEMEPGQTCAELPVQYSGSSGSPE